MSVLTLDKVSVGYGGSTAVFDASLQVEEGEIVALLGPNGAGKTTTLMSIAGFLPPTKGTIMFAGSNIAKTPPHKLARRGLGYVPDDRGLITSLTVRENLELVRGAALDPYELFPELGKIRNRAAGLLSGGEQQMLALARVLCADTKVLLIDELSLGLAPLIVDRLLRTLKEATERAKTAVLLVEQHVEQALAYADRIYVMVHGRIALEAPAEELRERRELLEASYLGDSAAPDLEHAIEQIAADVEEHAR